jgi:hypothetical protein
MQPALGAVLCVMAGVAVGTFLLPLKLSRHWAWENSWLLGVSLMFFVFPLLEAAWLVPQAPHLLREAGLQKVMLGLLAGVIQGAGALVFTYGVTLMGLSMGFSVLISVILAFSTLIPLFARHSNQLMSPNAITLLVGVVVIIIGCITAGSAGRRREEFRRKQMQLAEGDVSSPAGTAAAAVVTDPVSTPRRFAVVWLVTVSIFVGITSSMNYFVLEFQSDVTLNAVKSGVQPVLAPLVVMLPWYVGAFALNLIYLIGKMLKDGTLGNYFRILPGLGREYMLALSIGVLWYVGQGILYLAGFQKLGSLGVPVGAALFMTSVIVTSNVTGLRTKEWDDVPDGIRAVMYRAVALLVAGVVVIGVGNAF